MNTIKIYTDGCCLNNQSKQNKGGWAYIILRDNMPPIQAYGIAVNTTNQRMELKACIEAMKFALTLDDSNIEIFTDSAYVCNCVKDAWYLKWLNNGWKNSKDEKVKNKDLWEVFIDFLEIEYFKFTYVKGHSGDQWNEEADKLAKFAAKGV